MSGQGDWQHVHLGDAITLKRGYDLPGAQRSANGKVPIVSSAGVSGFHDAAKVCAPGIVTGRYGSIGKFFYLTEDFWPLNTTLYVEDFKGNHPYFIYFLLQTLDFLQLSGKTSVPGVNRNDLHRIPIKLPPLSEQRKIANILSTWDEAIDLTEQLIATKQKRKQALMQQLLTGKVRFPGFDAKWEFSPAGEVFQSVSKKNNDENEPLLSVTQDQGVLPRDMLETRVVNPEGSTKGYKLVLPGNFIISLRSFQGGLEYSGYRGLVSPAYTVLQAKKEIINDFYRYYFKSYEFIERLAIAVIGIRDGKQISYEDFCTLRLPCPSLPEQAAIGEILCTVDQEINLLQQKLAALRQQKKGLMQQLLTGKIRVKV